jgi:hypothetical protein
LSHTTMGTNVGTDYVKVTAVNDGDSSKTATDTKSISNTSSTSTSTTYGTPTVSIGSGIYADGGSATVTCSVTNTQTTTTSYTSGSSTSSDSSVAGTARWRITSNGNSAFTASGTSSSLSGVGTVYNSGGTITHSDMRNNARTDTVVVTAYNVGSTSKTATAQDVTTNSLSWKNPVYTQPGTGTSKNISLAAAGQTYTIVAAVTQKQEYTSGYVAQTVDLSNSVVYSVSTAKTGYSLDTSTHIVTVTNNESTSARNGFRVLLKCTGNANLVRNFTVTFNQSAGSQAYMNPVVTGFTYETFAAGGATKTPTVTYYQDYAWNGVAGSGTRTENTGGTLAYTTTGSLPSGFSTGSNYSTTGNVTWAGRGTTIGNSRDAKSNLTVTVTMNGKTSSAYTCTSCIQVGNYVTAIAPKDSSGGTGSHFSYANIGPGATSASPSLSGGATYTFTSGATKFDSAGSPSFGGTATYSRTYSLGAVQNGFSAVNSSTGVLTATSMGTTVMNARTSGTVTSVLTVTYTHASSYSAGGTVTSSTKSSTATCTQNANAITSISLTVGAATINYNGTTSATVTATFTSGATLNVSNDSGTTYSSNPTGIVTVAKS